MKDILILGAGTAGTMMANHLKKTLDDDCRIRIVDQRKTHYYQPGFLFIPFDIYKPKQVKKSVKKFIPKGVELIQEEIDKIIPDENVVLLKNETKLSYHILIIATGTDIAPDEIEGMSGKFWQKDIFDFYTFDGAVNLRNKLREW